MNSCFQSIKELKLLEGQVAVTWLGQAGYLIKSPSDKYILIDPYLSDYCEKTLGPAFKRLIPTVLEPSEIDKLEISAYLMTHHHEDHLDPLTIKELKNQNYDYYAPPTTLELIGKLGVKSSRLKPLFKGKSYDTFDYTYTGTYANHGELAPDAIGILIETQGKVIFHMGDTALNEEELHLMRKNTSSIDLLILPINGRYGNMNEEEAAKAVSILNPKQVLPCHFWMLPANSGGDPVIFMEKVSMCMPETKASLLTVGETMILT